MLSKAEIISEIRRTAAENGGKPLGVDRFAAETGIKPSDWQGKLWVRWGEALVEAGFVPNALQRARVDDDLLESLAMLARDLGHFPGRVEMEMAARTKKGFPWKFERFGNKLARAKRVRAYCEVKGYADVVMFCEDTIGQLAQKGSGTDEEPGAATEPDLGYVYLLKSGRNYKIGRSNAAGRREYELSIQLPESSQILHSIRTDDPVGIERYWHERFADRRKNGEWFALTAQDIVAFKRRKFM
jgi:hypothetical protein